MYKKKATDGGVLVDACKETVLGKKVLERFYWWCICIVCTAAPKKLQWGGFIGFQKYVH
jgi:hypothetical protein